MTCLQIVRKCTVHLANALLLLLVAGSIKAQNYRNTATINVSATVESISPVELVTIRELTITPEKMNNDMLLSISPLTSIHAAVLKALGQPDMQAFISCSQTETLYGDGKPVEIRYKVAGNQEYIQSAATLFETSPFNFTFNEKGEYFLWVGAEIELNVNTGSEYKGQITIEIEYL